MLFDEIHEDSLKPLRICRGCGKEAWKEIELELFIKDYHSLYNRRPMCKQCYAEGMKHKRATDPIYHENQKACSKEYHSKNKDRLNERSREYHHKTKDIRNANRREYSIKNKDKILAARKTEVYLARARFFTAERRRLKKGNKNILSEEDNLLIKKLYLQAKHLSSITNTVWEVDHIFPLKSHFMCGFHHPSNMQIIDHSTNNSKNNYLGFIGQYNLSPYYKQFNPRVTRKKVFEGLGVSLSWEEFLDYEKLHYGEYIEN